jgi:protein-disulfide isomerase
MQNFKTISIKTLLPLVMIICHAMPAFSQTTAPQSTDQIIKQLESSGALDKAVQKSLDRIKKREELAKEEEAKKQRLAQIERAKNARKVDLKTEPVYGQENAPITLIEYSDFECPYCKRFFDVPKKVVDDMPGQVNLVWRHFPLPFHEPTATKEAVASICAYQQGGSASFWKYAEAIFQNTKANNQGIPAEKGEDPLLKLATTQGLNGDQFKTCMANDADLKKQIAADIKDGQGAGVSGTPGLIIINKANGKVNFVNGALPVQAVKDAIKQIAN